MGFFDGLGRMIKGEPVFQPHDEDKGWKDSGDRDMPAGARYDPLSDKPVPEPEEYRGPKLLPKAQATRFEYDLNGNRVEYYFEIQNASERRLELDKIVIFNTKHELDRWMEPGEERELLVYRGPAQTHQHYDKCQLYYRDESGDYFMSEHWLGFKQEDAYYVIDKLRFLEPVRDV